MSATGVILQPSYVPWRGFFDLVHDADVFVFYDDVQYDKHGWRNRNRVKTSQGTQWITIPVLAKGNVADGVLLTDVRVASHEPWRRKHASTLRQAYAKAPFFAEIWPAVEGFFAREPERLCDFTIETTMELARLLGIHHTRFVRSSELGVTGGKTERLVRILQHVGADRYVSGPSAKDYLDEAAFSAAGIALAYKTYDYPPYEQLHGPFDPQVSVLDLLFMKGPQAASWIWGDRAGGGAA